MEIFIVIILGACFGSFVTAASYRLPRQQNILSSRSVCVSCNKVLRFSDLVPLVYRKKCNYCGSKISTRYFVIELVTLLAAIWLYSYYELTYKFILYFVLFVVLFTTLISDLETYIMPDSMTICALILGVINIFVGNQDWEHALLGFFVLLVTALLLKYGFLWLAKKDALGWGDIKFLPVVGLWIGLSNIPVYFVISGIFGIITALVWKKLYNNPIFPFGPALITAFFVIIITQ